MSTAGNTNIPNPGVPFLDQGGRISQVWWAFLLALFQRTGGGGTPTPPPTPVDLTPLIDAQAPLPIFRPAEDAPGPVSVPTFTSDPVEDIFASGTGFVPGTTTVLTLSKAYATKAAVLVHFDSAFQGTDQYSVSGNTITFTSPIPVGVSNVYARG